MKEIRLPPETIEAIGLSANDRLALWGVGPDAPVDIIVMTDTGLEKRTITARAIFTGQPDEETK